MMSTCPSKDIHSIYLDNELPAAYAGEYEAHIKVCPKCAAELAKLRAVREVLSADAHSLTPDIHYLDQSWERLQSRMSYSKVTKKIYHFPAGQLKYIIPTAAAAAVLAIILPVRAAKTVSPGNMTAVTPISRQKVISLAKHNIIINGNIQHEMLSPAAFKPQQRAESVSYSAVPEYERVFIQDQAVPGSIDPQLNDVDVFRPDFTSSGTITIRITVPGITTPPVSTEIALPAEQLTDIVK
jgi:hypothetical protein